MSLDDALFLVNRGGTNYKVSGADIGSKISNGDRMLVQRGANHFKATYDGSGWDKIQDSDLLLAWDGTNNRRVTGENFKALFGRICYLEEFQQLSIRISQYPPPGQFVAEEANKYLWFNGDSAFARNLVVGQEIEVENKSDQKRTIITVKETFSQTNGSGQTRWFVKLEPSSFPFYSYREDEWTFDSCPRRAKFTWNWRGHSFDYTDYQMCNNSRTGTGFYYTGYSASYFSDIDANNAPSYVTIHFDYLYQNQHNDREQWFKFGDAPAVQQLRDSSIQSSDCSFKLFPYQGSDIGQPYTESGIKVTYHNHNPDYCRKETYEQNDGSNCPLAGKLKMAWQDGQRRTVIRIPGADWAEVLKDGSYIWLNDKPYKMTNPVQNECGGDPDYTRIYIQERVEGNTETAGTMWTVSNCPP